MLVTNIGENLIENWKKRFPGRDVKSHLDHKRQEPQSFERHGFSARIGPTNDEDMMDVVQLERDWNGLLSRVAKGVFQQNMSCIEN